MTYLSILKNFDSLFKSRYANDFDFFICELNFQFHPLLKSKSKNPFGSLLFRIRSSRVGFHVYKICNLDQNVDTQNNYVSGRLLINLEYHLNLNDITELISDLRKILDANYFTLSGSCTIPNFWILLLIMKWHSNKKMFKNSKKKFRNCSKTTHFSIEYFPVISGREKGYKNLLGQSRLF